MEDLPVEPDHGERIPLFSLLESFSTALDLVSPTLRDHHRKTAWIAHRIAVAAGWRSLELRTLVFAALLHDIGCLSLEERIRCLEFERNFDEAGEDAHARVGFHLLSDFAPFADIAEIVLHQHAWWNRAAVDEAPVPHGSHVLHLADRVAVCLLPLGSAPPMALDDVRRRVGEQSGRMFDPRLAEAFADVSGTWDWEALASDDSPSLVSDELPGRSMRLGEVELRALARLFSHLIDFRSLHTATHSSGVAATSELLAEKVGLSKADCRRMSIAGLLHDLGKIAVPAELLDKPGRLTAEEYERVQAHAAFTERIVAPLGDLGGIRAWAAQHHERSDGSGYPGRLLHDDISVGGRVLATADVFTALTESRPYRRGLSCREALAEIEAMTTGGQLDPAIVSVLRARSSEIDAARAAAQALARREYDDFRRRAGL